MFYPCQQTINAGSTRFSVWLCLLNIGTILWPIILHNAVAVYRQKTPILFLLC